MYEDIKFKIQPAWVIVIDIFAAAPLYYFFRNLSSYELDSSFLFMVLLITPFLWIMVPLNYKMIAGIPAIVLTEGYLIDNLGKHTIAWHDITYINIAAGNRDLTRIVINLKDPEKYFNTPFKKMIYKIKQLNVSYDIAIMVDFVSGRDQEILQVLRACWDRSSGV